ncbi:unnamed protein product [Amoebophrya sp. A25]|nr:unnamed protein product [Amoebophrya sp. A25]|eukprot:GSA25T00001048001.1
MPLAMQFIRDHPEAVRASERARGRLRGVEGSEDLVSQILNADKEWRAECTRENELNRHGTELQAEIARLKKAAAKKRGKAEATAATEQVEGGAPAVTLEELISERKNVVESSRDAKTQSAHLAETRDKLVAQVGNIVRTLSPSPPSRVVEGDFSAPHDNVTSETSRHAQPVPRDPAILRMKDCSSQRARIIKQDGPPSPERRADSTATQVQERKVVLPHWELLRQLGMIDTNNRGSKLAGSRAYFLTGPGVLLNMALQNYAMTFLAQRGYAPVAPPLWMRPEVMAQTAELADFDEQLYKVVVRPPRAEKDGEKEQRKGDAPIVSHHGQSASSSSFTSSSASKPAASAFDKSNSLYLIATSEQPLSAMFAGERLDRNALPMRLAGISPCFRREGSQHGYETKGLFRVHNFDKVEQFALCHPTDSDTVLADFVSIAEEFYASLGLSYRVVQIPPQELNNAAAQKIDIEALFPHLDVAEDTAKSKRTSKITTFSARKERETRTEDIAAAISSVTGLEQEFEGTYRELVSCSNCTDYQSRALNICTGEGKDKVFVHLVNATLCATQRTICCLLENYQTRVGVVLPPVLRPFYFGGASPPVTFLPFTET